MEKKPKRAPRAKIEFWQDLVEHVNETWKQAKKVEHTYPFTGKDMKDLAHFARLYRVPAMMSLWDLYLSTADEYTLKHGLSIYTFTRQLPRLLDMNYKGMARQYEDALYPDAPPELTAILKSALPKKAETPKRVVFKTRLEYLLYKKTLEKSKGLI